MAAEKSKVLIIGGTGYIGKFVVEASVKAGHPTFALVRQSTVSDPVKGKLVEHFKTLGVTLLIVRHLPPHDLNFISHFYIKKKNLYMHAFCCVLFVILMVHA